MIQGWHKIKLEKVAKHIQSGGTPRSDNPDYYGGEISFVTIEDMTASNKYLYKTIKSISIEGLKNSATWIVPKDSVMYSIYATLGLPVISKVEAATNQAILNIIPNDEKVYTEYLYYYLLSIKNEIHKFSTQTTQSNLNAKIVKNFDLHIPIDVPEQTYIAKILSKADEAIEQTEKLIAKYQHIKTGLMQDLLTKGIDEYGNIRNEKTHRFKTENELRVPEEWEVVELESVCIRIADRDHTTPIYVADGVFIVSPKDFNDLHEIEFTKCLKITLEAHLINRRKTNIEVDDLIFTRIGAGLGKICKVTPEMPEFSILHSACMLKPNQGKILSDFLMYYIKSEFAQKQIVDGIQSIGVPDLGMDKIRTFLVKKPKSIDEQERILKPLLKLDNLIRKESAELSKLNALKTGLMKDLLSGKVRVKIKEETHANIL